jgi:aspartokinase
MRSENIIEVVVSRRHVTLSQRLQAQEADHPQAIEKTEEERVEEEEQRDTSELDFAPDQCMQAHVRSGQAIITLVGETLKARNTVVERLSAVCARRSALILPQNGESCSVQIVVPREHFAACTDILQDMFFTELDPAFFAPVGMTPIEQEPEPSSKTFVSEKQQVFSQSTSRFAFFGGRR